MVLSVDPDAKFTPSGRKATDRNQPPDLDNFHFGNVQVPYNDKTTVKSTRKFRPVMAEGYRGDTMFCFHESPSITWKEEWTEEIIVDASF